MGGTGALEPTNVFITVGHQDVNALGYYIRRVFFLPYFFLNSGTHRRSCYRGSLGSVLPSHLSSVPAPLARKSPPGNCMDSCPSWANCVGWDPNCLSVAVGGGAYFGAFCSRYGDWAPMVLRVLSFGRGHDFPKGFLHR